jgi:hypothetical protein
MRYLDAARVLSLSAVILIFEVDKPMGRKRLHFWPTRIAWILRLRLRMTLG